MRTSGWIAMIVAAVGWGTGGVATRAAFDAGADPWFLVTMRVVIAALLVSGLLLIQRSGIPDRTSLKVGLVMAITNLVVPYVLFTFAYAEASAGFVALFAALIPMATALFANKMLPNEPLTRWKLIGLSIGFAGVAALLVSGDSGLATGGRPLLAAGLAVLGVASIGYAGVYAKRHAGEYDPTEITGLQFIFGALILIVPTVVIEGTPGDLTTAGWVLILYLAVAATFLPFYLFYRLLRTVAATTVSLIGYIVPVIALIGGVIFLGEQITVGMASGGALILTGMVLTDRADRFALAKARAQGPS
jgi:drug/metabolite transporter (DMT)-like permease